MTAFNNDKTAFHIAVVLSCIKRKQVNVCKSKSVFSVLKVSVNMLVCVRTWECLTTEYLVTSSV